MKNTKKETISPSAESRYSAGCYHFSDTYSEKIDSKSNRDAFANIQYRSNSRIEVKKIYVTGKK
jgi:hypothetical protein